MISWNGGLRDNFIFLDSKEEIIEEAKWFYVLISNKKFFTNLQSVEFVKPISHSIDSSKSKKCDIWFNKKDHPKLIVHATTLPHSSISKYGQAWTCQPPIGILIFDHYLKMPQYALGIDKLFQFGTSLFFMSLTTGWVLTVFHISILSWWYSLLIYIWFCDR